VAAAIVLATASIRTGASTNTSTKCFICTRRPDGSGGDRTRLKTSLSAHHRVQLAWSSARCGIIIAVSAGRRTLPQACHHSPRNIHLEPPFRPSRPGHLTACARPSIHLHYYHYCTPIPSLLHRRCDASLCLAAARGASHCPAPNHGPSQVPLLKRTHPDAGLHTPCYSCPTHSRPLALAPLLRSASFEFPRHHHPIPVRATSPSSAATCASLCVALPRNAHRFTRAIDQSCHCDLTTV
jgi:hypothetical protein